MARPGLKQPPRHAVVIRLGDAPTEPEIPLARSSVPPPPPDCEPVVSASEKITERAIPTPKPEGVVASSAPGSALTTPVVESAPPPSDSPLVASIPAPRPSRAPESVRRRNRSRWTIVVAAAAGTVLGLLSVATTRRSAPHANVEGASISEPHAAVAAARPVGASPNPSAQASNQAPVSTPPQGDTAPAQSANQGQITPHAPAVWPPPPKDKRSIF
jgi:hypothetical protein